MPGGERCPITYHNGMYSRLLNIHNIIRFQAFLKVVAQLKRHRGHASEVDAAAASIVPRALCFARRLGAMNSRLTVRTSSVAAFLKSVKCGVHLAQVFK